MKKLRINIVLISIAIIAFIILSQVYIAYSKSRVDTNSYVKLVKGRASLNEALLLSGEKERIRSGDSVLTFEDSLAVIEWWDGSLTRLWANTKIKIEQEQISKDYTEINISFDLLAGKTWSQVISFIGKDSSFKQSFSGIEAGVRGTIFDVDLDNNFVRANNHNIDLQDTKGRKIELQEWEILNIETFSLVKLSKFIRDMEDKAWSTLNSGLDQEYINTLKNQLSKNIQENTFFSFLLDFISPKYRILKDLAAGEEYEKVQKNINKINAEKKESVYKAVLSEYQKMNFVDVKDYDFYKRKLLYKKALIDLASNDEDIKRLLDTTSYDFKDIAKQKLTEGLEETMKFIDASSKLLPENSFELPEVNLDYLPEDLTQSLLKNFDFGNIKLWDISDISGGVKKLEDGVQDFLDTNVGDFLKKIR